MKNRKWISICFYILLFVSLIVSYPYLKHITVDDIMNLSSGSIILAASLIIFLFALKCVAWFIPNLVLSVACGFIFTNPFVAFGVASFGVILEMSIGYAMGRCMKADKFNEMLEEHPKINRVVSLLNNKDAVCFLTRTMPVVPSDLTSIFLGFKKMSFLRYTVITYLGSIPGMIPCIIFGLLKDVKSDIFIISCVLYILFMIANVAYIILKFAKRRRHA